MFVFEGDFVVVGVDDVFVVEFIDYFGYGFVYVVDGGGEFVVGGVDYCFIVVELCGEGGVFEFE